MTLARTLLFAALFLTWGMDLAVQGWEQSLCQKEIHQLQCRLDLEKQRDASTFMDYQRLVLDVAAGRARTLAAPADALIAGRPEVHTRMQGEARRLLPHAGM